MSEKQVTIITIVILVLFLLAGGSGFYYLYFVVREEKLQELAGLDAQVNDANAKVSKIPALLKEIDSLEKQEKEKIQQIPDLTRMEYDAFANMLDMFRNQAGVNVSRGGWAVPTRPSPLPGRPPVNIPPSVHKIQYDLSVTGSFYQLLRYVNLLEQQRRFIGVQTFTIGKASGEGSEKGGKATAPKRDLKITIYSYTYKPRPTPFQIEVKEVVSGKSTDIPD